MADRESYERMARGATDESLQNMRGSHKRILADTLQAAEDWTLSIAAVEAEIARRAEEAKKWDGYPLNPEKDGYHWLRYKAAGGGPFPAFWNAGSDPLFGMWSINGRRYCPSGFAKTWGYLAPCEPPEESA